MNSVEELGNVSEDLDVTAKMLKLQREAWKSERVITEATTKEFEAPKLQIEMIIINLIKERGKKLPTSIRELKLLMELVALEAIKVSNKKLLNEVSTLRTLTQSLVSMPQAQEQKLHKLKIENFELKEKLKSEPFDWRDMDDRQLQLVSTG